MPKKKKIMIVDDEENLLILIRDLLASKGFDIVTAGNGKEALDVVEKENPDLLILDIMMPGMKGTDVARKIRKNPKTSRTKIIFLTILKSKEINYRILKKLMITDYITKPFDNQDLVRRINWAISK
jgi:DNA-binding response OmpR family regulator